MDYGFGRGTGIGECSKPNPGGIVLGRGLLTRPERATVEVLPIKTRSTMLIILLEM